MKASQKSVHDVLNSDTMLQTKMGSDISQLFFRDRYMPLLDWRRMYHQQNLQIHGIAVPHSNNLVDTKGRRIFREFRLQFSFDSTEMDAVSAKLPVVSAAWTPYSFRKNQLFHNEELLQFPGVTIYQVPIPPEESTWHLKGYTFPFRGSKNPYHELRINPRISGYCPGRCFFCHRMYSHRLKPKVTHALSPGDILDRIVEVEGLDVFQKINRVMVISELFGQEDRFLESVMTMLAELTQRGYPASREFNCCATDVRSLKGLQTLHSLVRPARYSFSLEFFHDRERLMGRIKGLPIEEIYRVLENARQIGFDEIQLNYLAGIDSLEECASSFKQLASRGLVDSVGLSTYTIFAEDQLPYRHATAWEPGYYLRMIEILNSLGIKIYKPESYDMGSPYTVLMEKTKL